jgi:hypothetical protein
MSRRDPSTIADSNSIGPRSEMRAFAARNLDHMEAAQRAMNAFDRRSAVARAGAREARYVTRCRGGTIMGRFDDVTVFVRAVEVGSFSSAAQELGIAKSIVSRRIVSLPNGLAARTFSCAECIRIKRMLQSDLAWEGL